MNGIQKHLGRCFVSSFFFVSFFSRQRILVIFPTNGYAYFLPVAAAGFRCSDEDNESCKHGGYCVTKSTKGVVCNCDTTSFTGPHCSDGNQCSIVCLFFKLIRCQTWHTCEGNKIRSGPLIILERQLLSPSTPDLV